MKIKVTQIGVEFSRGSFSEWANNQDEHPDSDVARWETAYNKQIGNAIQDMYPHATVEVGEGYDQLMHTKYFIDFDECSFDEDYEIEADYDRFLVEEEIKEEIEAIIAQVANDGSFWEAR